MRGLLLAGVLATFSSFASAADKPLNGKDLFGIIHDTLTEGPDQQKYIGKSFADKASFWRLDNSGKQAVIEVVVFDGYLHPSYTYSGYIACTVDAKHPVLQQIAAGKITQGDRMMVSGQISDVLGEPTQDEPDRSVMTLKPGCVIKAGWGK
jgi:hypothetical protein